MYIEAITVCVNFSDILAHSLVHNKHLFDRMVVVTDSADTATRKLCDYHYVECIITDEFYRNEQAFNKGRGINAGLAKLSMRDWVLHIDADIVLPARSRSLLEKVVRPEPDCIYGIDRMMCPDFTTWARHMAGPDIQHANEIFVIPDSFPMGTRVAKLDGEGYLPIGFFQLWHPGTTELRAYPDEHGTAGRGDMLHALKWPRRKRVLIPEIISIHLGSPIAKGTNNWRGRRAVPFGPTLMPAQCGTDEY